MPLPRYEPKQLPPIGYAYPAGAALPHPDAFLQVTNQPDLNRPANGLWCAPVTGWNADGTPRSTAWTDWCTHPDDLTGQPHVHHVSQLPYREIVQVHPLPGARIYRIDDAADLDRLVQAYRLPDHDPMHRSAPDWEKLRDDGWDAVFATHEGVAANGLRHVLFEPSLYGWECASVLWLRATYRLDPA